MDRAEKVGVLSSWVVNIPLSGRLGRRVRSKLTGSNRAKNRLKALSLGSLNGSHPCVPSSKDAAGHPNVSVFTEESRCGPSSEAAGHACGPSIKAERRKKSTVFKTLKIARSWQDMIDKGEVKNASQIAAYQNLTRARISQIMVLLRLAPPILRYLEDVDRDIDSQHLTERKIRCIANTKEQAKQIAMFEELVGMKLVDGYDEMGDVADVHLGAVNG